MPVIAFVSPKGGVGKTTSAVLLASQLAREADVTVIDADANKPVAAWAALGDLPARLQIVSEDISAETIIQRIDEAHERNPFVIVDCEGTANAVAGDAIGVADLVVIPMQGSQLDAAQAGKALGLVKRAERIKKEAIRHAILLTRTSPSIRGRTLQNVQNQLRQHGVELFETELNEREAFRAMFSFGGTLESLDSAHVSGIEKAQVNARAYAAELVAMLRGETAEPETPRLEVA